MLSKTPVNSKSRWIAAALPFAAAAVIIGIRSTVLWLGTNLAVRPWTDTRVEFWAAAGTVISLMTIKEIFADTGND